MTTDDEARLAEIRERIKRDTAMACLTEEFLLRLLDERTAENKKLQGAMVAAGSFAERGDARAAQVALLTAALEEIALTNVQTIASVDERHCVLCNEDAALCVVECPRAIAAAALATAPSSSAENATAGSGTGPWPHGQCAKCGMALPARNECSYCASPSPGSSPVHPASAVEYHAIGEPPAAVVQMVRDEYERRFPGTGWRPAAASGGGSAPFAFSGNNCGVCRQPVAAENPPRTVHRECEQASAESK